MTDSPPADIRGRLSGFTGKLRGGTLLVIVAVVVILYMLYRRRQNQQAAAAAAAVAADTTYPNPSQAAVGDLYSPFSSYPYSPAGASTPYAGAGAGAYGQPAPLASSAAPAVGASTNAAVPTPANPAGNPWAGGGNWAQVAGQYSPSNPMPINPATGSPQGYAPGLPGGGDPSGQVLNPGTPGTPGYLNTYQQYGVNPAQAYSTNDTGPISQAGLWPQLGFVKMKAPNGDTYWVGPDIVAQNSAAGWIPA